MLNRRFMDDVLVTHDGSRTFHSKRYYQSYHSLNGALTEARHVFLDASGVSQRLQHSKPTSVLEIGFGLGLNALLTCDLATTCAARLDYHSIEHDLIDAQQFRQMDYGSLLTNSRLSDILINWVMRINGQRSIPGAPVSHTRRLAVDIDVTLHLEDATKTQLLSQCPHTFNAIYLDAFSPDTNAECWQPDFIAQLSTTLVSDGKLSTYCSKGDVRRAMLAAGLQVKKLPGPPGKREMLVGTKVPPK